MAQQQLLNTFLQGNTHAKRSIGGEDVIEAETSYVGSPPMSPGSPLTYSPQVAMEPIPKQDDSLGQRPATEFVGAAGWPAQPKLVPVVIACELHPGCCRHGVLDNSDTVLHFNSKCSSLLFATGLWVVPRWQ